MNPGLIIAGNKLYAICPMCQALVRVNKPILGDLHFCLTEEEIRERRKKAVR